MNKRTTVGVGVATRFIIKVQCVKNIGVYQHKWNMDSYICFEKSSEKGLDNILIVYHYHDMRLRYRYNQTYGIISVVFCF